MKSKIYIIIPIIIFLLFSVFIYWKWERNRSDRTGSEQNRKWDPFYKLYTKAELDDIFSNSINQEKQIIPFFGKPARKEYLDPQNKKVLYVYSYRPELLEKTDESQYGTGIAITCENGKLIHWDILKSDIVSKVPATDELNKLIHHGLTSSEVRGILGEPQNISRAEELIIYYYMFPAEKSESKNGSIPVGINIMFIDDKVVNWGIVRVVYGN